MTPSPDLGAGAPEITEAMLAAGEGIITLTKHPRLVGAELPATVDAPKMEISPEMIEAGLRAYQCHCPDAGDGLLDRQMVEAVTRAVLGVALQGPK